MASLVDKCFSQADFDAIEAAVKKAELSTNGEIMVELASHCRHWRTERAIYALVFALVCLIAALYLTRDVGWGTYYNWTQGILWAVVGFVVAYFGWSRFLDRTERKRKAVWNRALDLFQRITPTRGLTGILIFVSVEEKQAAIVADKGIASKVPPDYWHAPHALIAGAMAQDKHAEGIVQAIDMIAGELARYFPRESDDINELPDKPKVVD
jgi:putative membrane protein